MSDSNDVPEKGMNPWGQAISAVALVAALALGFWALTKTQNADGGAESKPAACSGGAAQKGGKAADRVHGDELCEALNRSDLAELLGTPGETAKSASGNDESSIGTGREKIANPSARVEFATYTVTLSATYDKLPVGDSAVLLGQDGQLRKVLGRPGAFYSTQTMKIGFRLDGSDATSAPGVPARVLDVALDAEDKGGSYELALWRSDGGVPDDATLLQIAETVLPRIPGWSAAG